MLFVKLVILHPSDAADDDRLFASTFFAVKNMLQT